MKVIDSHEQSEMVEVFQQMLVEVPEQGEEVSVVLWGGFPKVIQVVFPNAMTVFNRLHVMQAVNSQLNRI